MLQCVWLGNGWIQCRASQGGVDLHLWNSRTTRCEWQQPCTDADLPFLFPTVVCQTNCKPTLCAFAEFPIYYGAGWRSCCVAAATSRHAVSRFQPPWLHGCERAVAICCYGLYGDDGYGVVFPPNTLVRDQTELGELREGERC